MIVVKWLAQAKKDMERLDESVRIRVFKTLEKLKQGPAAYGKPLGNHSDTKLKGLYKIEPADCFRIVYHWIENEQFLIVAAVGKRANDKVYKTAGERIAEVREMINSEIKSIKQMLNDEAPT